MAIRALPKLRFVPKICQIVKISCTCAFSGPIFTIWLQYVPVIWVFQELFLNIRKLFTEGPCLCSMSASPLWRGIATLWPGPSRMREAPVRRKWEGQNLQPLSCSNLNYGTVERRIHQQEEVIDFRLLPGGNFCLIVSWSGLIHNSDRRYTSYSAWHLERWTIRRI